MNRRTKGWSSDHSGRSDFLWGGEWPSEGEYSNHLRKANDENVMSWSRSNLRHKALADRHPGSHLFSINFYWKWVLSWFLYKKIMKIRALLMPSRTERPIKIHRKFSAVLAFDRVFNRESVPPTFQWRVYLWTAPACRADREIKSPDGFGGFLLAGLFRGPLYPCISRSTLTFIFF